MRTELGNRMIGSGANARASFIVLVCRKRGPDAPDPEPEGGTVFLEFGVRCSAGASAVYCPTLPLETQTDLFRNFF